jgi:hypothetical protein
LGLKLVREQFVRIPESVVRDQPLVGTFSNGVVCCLVGYEWPCSLPLTAMAWNAFANGPTPPSCPIEAGETSFRNAAILSLRDTENEQQKYVFEIIALRKEGRHVAAPNVSQSILSMPRSANT